MSCDLEWSLLTSRLPFVYLKHRNSIPPVLRRPRIYFCFFFVPGYMAPGNAQCERVHFAEAYPADLSHNPF